MTGPLGCVELARRGLVDESACCEACHSAEGYAAGFVLGPCRAVLPGGEQAFVCCSSSRRLVGTLNGTADGARGETQRR